MNSTVYLEPSSKRADGGAQVGKWPGSIELRDLHELGHAASPVRAALQRRVAGQGGANEKLSLSRRSMLVTLAAALAPAAGTAVALPKVVATAITTLAPPALPALAPAAAGGEAPELLALGAELEVKLDAYRVAAARLAEARATAAGLWPEAPAAIVVSSRRDRERFVGCFEREVDCEREVVWPPTYWKDGQLFAIPPRQLLSSGLLLDLLDRVRANPEYPWQEGFEREVLDRIAEAERYEDACADAIEASDVEGAKREVDASADALRALVGKMKKHPPRTLGGLLIHAGALSGYPDLENDGFFNSRDCGTEVLGRDLAEAVLRVASMAS